ncbi:MAG: hypothetical protein ACPHSD_09745, partial [Candidatus Latescibacterota bacterium]
LADILAMHPGVGYRLAGEAEERSESMGSLVNADIAPAVEVGPGSVLKGLMRRIARGVTVLGAGTVDDIEQTAAQLKGEN